jgi:hypothetical protein
VNELSPGLWVSTFIFTLSIWMFRYVRNPLPRKSSQGVLQAVLFIVISTYITEQAIRVEQQLATDSPIHALPKLFWLYLVIHFAIISWILLSDLFSPLTNLPVIWPMLFIFSSYIYFRLFFFTEQVIIYPILYGSALISIVFEQKKSWIDNNEHRPLLITLFVFLLFIGLSTLRSADIYNSLNIFLQIVIFGLLPFWLTKILVDKQTWRVAVICLMILSSLLLSGLGIIKLFLLIQYLGIFPTLTYRLYISDIGPNWISFPLVTLLPLTIGLFLTAKAMRKLIWGIGSSLMMGVIFFSQSNVGFSGWIALVVGFGTFALILGWKKLLVHWLNHVTKPVFIGLVSPILIFLLATTGIIIAQQVNSYSFYARFYNWSVTLFQIVHHPLIGSGMGVSHTIAQYANLTHWQDTVRIGGDAVPYFLLSQLIKQKQVLSHAHNLFLELARGAGLPALLAFIWFLWRLGKYSLSIFNRAHGEARVLIAGCIAGLVAALGWGLIDVMEYSPPFFTTPVWALIGLLLAAPKAWGLESEMNGSQIGDDQPTIEN